MAIRSHLARLTLFGLVFAASGGVQATAAEPLPSPPTVHVALNGGAVATTNNAFDFRPGLIRLSVSDPTTGWANCPLWVLRLDDGYTFTEFRRDQLAVMSGDMAAGARLNANSDHLGGASVLAGHTLTSTLTLPSAGRYIMTVFRGGKEFTRPIQFRLAGEFENRAQVATDATIVASADGQFTGDTHLPTSGSLRFTNNDDQPNFLELFHVVTGTTTQQVLDWLQSGDPSTTPEWMLDGHVGMVVLDPGTSETREYLDKPAGDYVAFSMVPNAAGIPAAFTGMVEIVHLDD